MKSNLIKDFNLPNYVKGKSFAEASKAIEKKFADRTDTAALETKEELMGRLAKAQEHLKMQESLKANSQQVPDMMGGQVPQGFEEFAGQTQMANGGVVGAGLVEDATIEQQQAAMSGIAGMAGTALELGIGAFGPTGVDTSGQQYQEKESMGLGIAGGAMKGATAGAALGPWGAAGGALVGGVLGGIGTGAANKDIEEGQRNNMVLQGQTNRSQWAYGGNMGDPTDPPTKKPSFGGGMGKHGGIHSLLNYYKQNNLGNPAPIPEANGPTLGPEQYTAYQDWVDRSGIMNMPYQPKANGTEQAAYLSTVENVATPKSVEPKPFNINDPLPFDKRNGIDPNSPLYNEALNGPKPQPTLDMSDTTESVEEEKDLETIDPKEATPEQRKAIEALGIKYNPKVNLYDIDKDTKAVSDSFVTDRTNKQKMDAKVAEVLQKHKDSKPEGSKFNLNASRLAEFAPAAMSALQLAQLDKPDKETLDRLDTRYKKNYVDERSLENRVQNEHANVANALTGSANGSAGALRSNLLGASLNKTKATSEAFLRADDINRKEDRAAQQFDSRVDSMNLQQSNRENEINARNKGAYESNKSMLQSTLAANIGAIGKETTDRKSIAKMFGYSVDGDYLVGKDGKRITWKEFQKEVKAYQKSTKNE